MRFVLLSLLVACAPLEPDRTEPLPFKGQGFRAQLRRDVLHSADTPTDGVTLYDFHVGSMPLMFAYVGPTPGFPHFAWAPEADQQSALPSGLPARCRGSQRPDGAARECLITLNVQPPKQLHVWYEKLQPNWAQAADGMIASIAPR